MLINDLLSVWRQGRSLASASTWSNTAAAGATLTGLLTATFHLAKAFGYEIPGATDEAAAAIAGGVAAVVCLVSGVLHVVANPAGGLPAARNPGDSPGA